MLFSGSSRQSSFSGSSLRASDPGAPLGHSTIAGGCGDSFAGSVGIAACARETAASNSAPMTMSSDTRVDKKVFTRPTSQFAKTIKKDLIAPLIAYRPSRQFVAPYLITHNP
jgi:hypothetical protein